MCKIERMDFAPILKFVSIKVDDLQYSEKYFENLFEMSNSELLDITSQENSDKNETHDTSELFSNEGGASLQFVEIDSDKTSNPKPNLLQLGIIGIKIKSRNIMKSYFHYRDLNIQRVTNIRVKPLYHKHFHIITQEFLFQIKEDKHNFFGYLGKKNGGINGIIIGVSNIEKSKEFYQKVLGYDVIVYEGKGEFEDFDGIEGGNNIFKRVILQQSNPATNVFTNYFGKSDIELLQVIEDKNITHNDTNVVNPYRFGYFTVDNRDIIGNYLELGYNFDYKGNEKYIQITDPDGIVITCQESASPKKPNVFDDIKIFAKITKQKL